MKLAVGTILGMAIACALIFVPASGRTQTSKATKIIQAPVPPNTAPVASKDQPYVYRKMNDRLYILAEIHQPFPKNEVNNPPHTQQMGLIIGNKKAALIDTGLGLADLRKFVSQFTDLPIIVLNTHGHLDHVGANSLFDMCYINKEDEKAMLSSTREGRLNGYKQFMEGNTEMIAFAEKNMVADKPFKYDFIKDGDQIDLGGVSIEVVGFPGHSPGSVAFIDRRDKVAFCGDSILFRVLLSDRAKVAQFIKSLDNFAEKTKGIDTIINGHQWEPFHRKDIDEERALATAVENRTIKGTPLFLLGVDRIIYVLGSKRIGLTDDK